MWLEKSCGVCCCSCDNNAQEASTRLVGMGYAKRDTPITRPHRTEIQRPVLPPEPKITAPPTPADRNRLICRLKEQFPAVSRTLISMAVETSRYDEDRAKQFLTAMTPQDGSKRPVPSTEDTVIKESLAPASVDTAPKVEEEPAAATKPVVHPSPSATPATVAPAEPAKSPQHKSRFRLKFRRDKKKSNKTEDSTDAANKTNNNKSKAKGPDPTHRKGPFSGFLLTSVCVCLRKNYIPWFGSNSKNRKGPDPALLKGPDTTNLRTKGESRAKGPASRRNPLTDITQQQQEIVVESG
ncbi:hypothetical protein LAZ67_22001037 [Cordylochernes scorpioides]|uniref:CUE domain-containing protein n=1 Tax=Cordylochernes scorpioides TaxID=51811 RepID=A0ABY6LNN4_9ARAC|nr:hypothetical protein LAZ67_22001037 [Cordylochernes scorpioides]